MSAASVEGWLDSFAACVRDRDLERGRTHFVTDVTSFGTRASHVSGLDHLVEQQWRPIWTTTSGFRFDLEYLRTFASGDAGLAVAAVTWSSRGEAPDGAPIVRRGRATLVLEATVDGPHGLRAVHSHFSEEPGPPR